MRGVRVGAGRILRIFPGRYMVRAEKLPIAARKTASKRPQVRKKDTGE